MGHLAIEGPWFRLPRAAVRFPVEWKPKEDFVANDATTWPQVEGRLEYVEGRLSFMPPCGEIQQETVADITVALVTWARQVDGFSVGTNEAGMKLGPDVRAADVGVWRREHGAQFGFRRVAPILAVEVAGQDEDEATLREKAAWYLEHGVEVVWLVLPTTREVVVLTPDDDVRLGPGDATPPHSSLTGLTVPVAALFVQIDR